MHPAADAQQVWRHPHTGAGANTNDPERTRRRQIPELLTSRPCLTSWPSSRASLPGLDRSLPGLDRSLPGLDRSLPGLDRSLLPGLDRWPERRGAGRAAGRGLRERGKEHRVRLRLRGLVGAFTEPGSANERDPAGSAIGTRPGSANQAPRTGTGPPPRGGLAVRHDAVSWTSRSVPLPLESPAVLLPLESPAQLHCEPGDEPGDVRGRERHSFFPQRGSQITNVLLHSPLSTIDEIGATKYHVDSVRRKGRPGAEGTGKGRGRSTARGAGLRASTWLPGPGPGPPPCGLHYLLGPHP